MICPFCGKEMDEGYVNGRGSGHLFVKGNLYWNNPDFKWSGYKRELVVDHYDWGTPYIFAYKCDDCKKIIMDTYIKEEFW